MGTPARPRVYTCEDCGELTARKRHYKKSNVCLPCGTTRAAAAMHAMVSRDGPAWQAHQRNPGGRPRKIPPPA